MTELQMETSGTGAEQEPASAATQAEATGQQVQNSESAPETQAEDKSNVQNRINKITAEKYAEKRRADELEQRLKNLENSSPQQTASQEDLRAPTPPEDYYDEEAVRKYNQEMHSYTLKKAEQLAAQSAAQALDKTRADEKRRADQQEQARVINQYAEQGLKDGLTVEQMQLNEQILNNSGLSSDLGMHIMSDPKGAAIAAHLANNAEVLNKVNGMSPMQAAAFIESSVKPNIGGQKIVTSAPDPVQPLSGGGVREQDEFDKICPGAQFESS